MKERANRIHPPRGKFHDRRAAVQFAADAEWPSTNAANAGIRGEFFLPLRAPCGDNNA
jgi:hypothetical protein